MPGPKPPNCGHRLCAEHYGVCTICRNRIAEAADSSLRGTQSKTAHLNMPRFVTQAAADAAGAAHRAQQLEQRLNQERQRDDGADRSGKPPAGVIKSLTLRSGSDDDRLRIYWANGSTTDLPCTKEQSTLVCG
jgi:hypothetical protein